MQIDKRVLGFAAPSGTGKTTLLKQLIPLLKQSGLSIGLVKHSHHDVEVDVPGKDSYELRHAGAEQVVLASAYRTVAIKERTDRSEPTLQEALDNLNLEALDLILVEGFRDSAFPKIELHRPTLGRAPLYLEDDNIIAIATDDMEGLETDMPILNINTPQAVADYILKRFESL